MPTTKAVTTTSRWSSSTYPSQARERTVLMASFDLAAFQNEYLPVDAAEVNAVITVSSHNGAIAATSPSAGEKAVILIVDSSGSMGQPDAKIRAARGAAKRAAEMLPDGTLFAIVGG